MQIRRPGYFDEFRCIASACPDSCCKEWDVQVDDHAAAYYQTLTGPLGDRLRQVMYAEDGTWYFAIEPDGRCPMWRDDGLCRLQAERGEQALCKTCREFPRLTHDYGDFVERGLELSCPEAARLILSAERKPWLVEEKEGGRAEYDEDAMSVLLHSREKALDIISDEGYSVAESLALLLIHGYQTQQWLDEGEPVEFQPDAALGLAWELACEPAGGELTAFFRELEILTPQWKNRLEDGWQGGTLPEQCRAMARYFVERYYLQAVSDYDLAGRVKLALVSCLMVSGLGGDFVQTAQLYSKEIENSIDNVEAILDGAYTSPALTDAKLLGLLLK